EEHDHAIDRGPVKRRSLAALNALGRTLTDASVGSLEDMKEANVFRVTRILYRHLVQRRVEVGDKVVVLGGRRRDGSILGQKGLYVEVLPTRRHDGRQRPRDSRLRGQHQV